MQLKSVKYQIRDQVYFTLAIKRLVAPIVCYRPWELIRTVIFEEFEESDSKFLFIMMRQIEDDIDE